MRELPPGIERTPFGFRAYICVVDAAGRHRRSKRFPRTATLDSIKAWRETARVDLRRELAAAPKVQIGIGFLADADRYLESVQALPTFKERRRHIQEWAIVFGERVRSTITSAEIRAQRDRWLTVGPKCIQERQPDGSIAWVAKPLPLSASAVNHRLRALQNLWTVLDGPHAYNPVREVPEAPEPTVEPRAIPYALIARILAQLPESKTKTRLAVIAHVGLSHAQLMLVQPDDLNLRAGTLYLRPRRKGQRTTKGVTIPLSEKGQRAFRRFVALDAFGPFSSSSMRRAFQRACADLKLPPTLTPYQLRHSFGTLVYTSSGDLHATGLLMGHRDARTTQRYTLGAVDPRLQAAVNAMQIRTRRGGVPSGGFSTRKRFGSVRTGQSRTSKNAK